jgi:hypothetical protein
MLLSASVVGTHRSSAKITCQASNRGSACRKLSLMLDKNPGSDPPESAIVNTPRSVMAWWQMVATVSFRTLGTASWLGAIIRQCFETVDDGGGGKTAAPCASTEASVMMKALLLRSVLLPQGTSSVVVKKVDAGSSAVFAKHSISSNVDMKPCYDADESCSKAYLTFFPC